MIYRRQFLAGLGAGACAAAFGAEVGAQRKPNVLLILADDLGYSDLGCYGNSFCETPNLDALAVDGMRFTDAYAPAPICSASRAAILTGKTPARLHFEFVTKNDGDYASGWADRYTDKKLIPPVYTLNLPLAERTIAETFQSAGYATGITGKWHVSSHYKHYQGWSPTHGPAKQGFEWAKEGFGAHPYGYDRATRNDFGDYAAGEFPRDALTENAIEYLEHHREQPFFLMVSHYYVHTPLGTKAKWLLDKYKRKLGADDLEKRALYGAFVETLDHYVGQLLDALERLGLAEDTLVLFTSDNGGHPEFAFNAPLRGSKWNLYEGGVRVPTIARWPGTVESGSTCDVPVSGIDFFPTCCALAGAEPGANIDGESILPLLRGGDAGTLADRPLVWHFPYYHPERNYDVCPARIGIEDGYVSQTQPQSSIRKGDHKLIYFYEDGRRELYDLAADVGEQQDLAGAQPALANRLERELIEYLASVDARLPRRHP